MTSSSAASDTNCKTDDSAARLQLALESLRDYAIFLLDTNGRVESWNAGAELMKGYTGEEIIGKDTSMFYSPEERAQGKPRKLLDMAAEHGRVEDEGWRLRKDGSKFWADVIITSIRDSSGVLCGFTKVTRDHTVRRAAEETLRQSEERFRLMIEDVTDYAIFMLDPNGYIATWNSGAQRIKGYKASEIIGRHFSVFYSEDDVRSGKCELELKIARAEGRVEDEGWRIRNDGTKFWASVVITALRNTSGELVGFGKVTRDLTERRNAEQNKIRLAQAEESVRLRDEFLSIASHELKTPLTAVQLQLHSLVALFEKDNERLAGRIRRAAKSCDRLNELIESLLEVSRIASGRFELNRTETDLSTLAFQVVDALRETAATAGCQVDVHTAGPIIGVWDRLRIEQIMMNLLSNALKYGAGAAVHLEVGRDGGQAVIIVRDHGPGMEEKDLLRIFERFERATSMRHYGGLGLGLYITQQIVEAHGGKVTARNAPGGGAEFEVRLPVPVELQRPLAAGERQR